MLCQIRYGSSNISFKCNSGLRQDENLSALLFSIFFNDRSEFISHNSGFHAGLRFAKRLCMSNVSDGYSEVCPLYQFVYFVADDIYAEDI